RRNVSGRIGHGIEVERGEALHHGLLDRLPGEIPIPQIKRHRLVGLLQDRPYVAEPRVPPGWVGVEARLVDQVGEVVDVWVAARLEITVEIVLALAERIAGPAEIADRELFRNA